jgi:hypothetical protein
MKRCNFFRSTVFWGHNRGEVIMGHIQKATAAAIALTITLVGSTLAVAPMARADSQQIMARAHHWSASHFHRLAADLPSASSSARAG